MAELPTGTVTLLFSDVEGSTRLLHELGAERYAEVLAEHRGVLRAVFAAHHGVEVDTQGDSFFYAFARASDALAATEAGQLALDGGPVRVRMGVHTGEPRVTEEGYVGADVHLAARVMGAGHGGQVLVSEATARLVEAELRDLGEHRLKDIERPVRLFQLGEGRFPPLKTLNNSNLPLVQTPLLGRKKELADVLRLLRVERARLVTVTGPGGIGKTRFALEAAHELVDHFPHGVWFVDLSALRDPTLVAPAIARTVGAAGDLARYLGDKHVLLVLDNFEQVIDAVPTVTALLGQCAHVYLVVTSREPLHLAGEHAYPLRPLAQAPAVELFRARAEAVDPQFSAPWPVLAAVVERLDSVPLALELAAARAKFLAGDEILERLAQRLPLLVGRRRDVPERHRTLTRTIEWSYDLLSSEERRVFRALGVFVGGWSLPAARVVAETDLDTLESLVDRSLVTRRDTQHGRRYGLLEAIREYADERLEEAGEAPHARRRHAQWFGRVAEEILQAVGASSDRSRLDELDVDAADLGAALAFAAQDDPDLAATIGGSTWLWWVSRGRTAELERHVALLVERELVPRSRALTLFALAEIANARLDAAALQEYAEEFLVLARALDLGPLACRALALLAGAAFGREDVDRGRALYLEAIECVRDAAPAQLPTYLGNLGWRLRGAGRLDEARTVLDEAVERARAAGPYRLPMVLSQRANLALDEEQFAQALAHYREALLDRRALTDRRLLAVSVSGIASALAGLGESERAACLWGAARRILEELTMWSTAAAADDRLSERLRDQLGEPRYEQLAAEGAALSDEDVRVVAIERAQAAGIASLHSD